VVGLALNDIDLIKLGIVGYYLETLATSEYWLDLYNDNFPSSYPHEYCGILRSGQLNFGTYFCGDAGWVLGIQAVPNEMYYQPYGENPNNMRRVWESMVKERGCNNGYDCIVDMDPYLGGYHLGLVSTYDPQTASDYLDRLYDRGGEWQTHVNIATQYYVTHAYLSYGRPARGYHTSLISGAVYQNANNELTYLIYNPNNEAVDVQIYQNGNVIDTVNVKGRTYFNSRG
jgi:hypothetical protein